MKRAKARSLGSCFKENTSGCKDQMERCRDAAGCSTTGVGCLEKRGAQFAWTALFQGRASGKHMTERKPDAQ